MKFYRILTTLKYIWFHFRHSIETWVDIIWFPVVEILVFGLFSHFFARNNPELAQIILIGLIFWEVVRIVQYAISVGVMWDVWSKSFSSLFISPLSVAEFVIGQSIGGLIKAFLIFLILSVTGSLLFGISPFVLSPLGNLLYILLLSIFGISAGMFVFSLVLRFGSDIQSFSWSLIYLFQPISAVIYPVEALPESLHWLAYSSPITYVMEAMRYELRTGLIDWRQLGWALIVGLIYLVLNVIYLKLMLAKARKSGRFARMES